MTHNATLFLGLWQVQLLVKLNLSTAEAVVAIHYRRDTKASRTAARRSRSSRTWSNLDKRQQIMRETTKADHIRWLYRQNNKQGKPHKTMLCRLAGMTTLMRFQVVRTPSVDARRFYLTATYKVTASSSSIGYYGKAKTLQKLLNRVYNTTGVDWYIMRTPLNGSSLTR